MSDVSLAVTLHDPEGRLLRQAERVLPTLQRIYRSIAVLATYNAHQPLLQLLERAGAHLQRDSAEAPMGLTTLGRTRRMAVALSVEFGADWIHFCDFDRVIHWAEYEPAELERALERIKEQDFTILGRTGRAFASHPRTQRDTEALVNHVYSQLSGHEWDVTTASRGLSRRAASFILHEVHDDSIGSDVSWPLALQQHGGFSLGYLETEGLEYETADRYAHEIAAAGGLEAWIAHIDADPRNWVQRIEIARIEIEAMIAFHKR